MQRRSLVVFAILLAVAVVLGLWRPRETRVAPAVAADPAPPTNVAAVTVLKKSGAPCGVEILGTGGSASNLASATLAAGEARSTPFQFPAPYTIDAVSVTRDGVKQRREVKMTLAGGRRYELVINADDTIAVAPAAP